MARYPNYDPSKKTAAYQGFAADAFSKERVEGWADPTGGYIHAMHRSRWGGYHYRITGKDAAGEVTYEGGWQNNRQMGMHKEFRMVENIFEELDAPGEWDLNSINGDPLFVDPENGDFSVKEGSPAFQVGFKNFPMDQFGVKKAGLRAIAETPEIPEIRNDGGGLAFGQKKKDNSMTFDWLGAKLKELEGEEYSAFGVAKSDGGLAVKEVQAGSLLNKTGIKVGDLILAINNQPTRNRKMFQRVVAKEKEPLKLTIVRNQENRTITVKK